VDQSLSIGHACSKAECVGCIEKQDFVDRLLEVRETELYRVQAELGEYGIKSKINDGSIGADEASATEERADAVDAKAQKGKKAEKAKAEAQKEEKRLNAKLKKKVVRACYRARVRLDTHTSVAFGGSGVRRHGRGDAQENGEAPKHKAAVRAAVRQRH
jgi:hypothetical protein